MLSDYLKPEFVGTKEATEINMLFQNLKPNCRMVLRVPMAEGDRVTRFLKRAVKPEYIFHRRAGGGKRYDGMALTCLVENATYFKYYFDRKQTPNPVTTNKTVAAFKKISSADCQWPADKALPFPCPMCGK